MGKVRLEIDDTGNKTANLILFFNEFIHYARNEAGLSNLGISRVVDIFKEGSTEVVDDEQ